MSQGGGKPKSSLETLETVRKECAFFGVTADSELSLPVRMRTKAVTWVTESTGTTTGFSWLMITLIEGPKWYRVTAPVHWQRCFCWTFHTLCRGDSRLCSGCWYFSLPSFYWLTRRSCFRVKIRAGVFIVRTLLPRKQGRSGVFRELWPFRSVKNQVSTEFALIRQSRYKTVFKIFHAHIIVLSQGVVQMHICAIP